MVIFTYGKAMRGGPEHDLLTGCRFLGRGCVQGKAVAIVDRQPVAVLGEVLWGEAYAVPDSLEDRVLGLIESRIEHAEHGLDWEDALVTVDGFGLRCQMMASALTFDEPTSANYRVRPSFPRHDRRRFERTTTNNHDDSETSVPDVVAR